MKMPVVKSLGVGLLLLLAFSLPVRASEHDYSFSHNGVNLYDTLGTGIIYDLTGLNSSTQYTFTLQALNLNTGQFSVNLESIIVGSGVTLDTITFDLNPYGQLGGIHTPLRVIDNFGQVLDYHFVTPTPDDVFYDDTTILADNKQGIGGVVYNATNAFGYQHEDDLSPIFTPTITTDISGFSLKQEYQRNSVVFNPGNYPLLHFQNGIGYDATEKIQIFNVGTQVMVAEFVMDDLACFLYPGTGDLLTTFIVLSINGTAPLWYNTDRLNTCFDEGDSPILNLPIGAYSYGRVDSLDVLIAEGESIFLITSDSERQVWNIAGRYPSVRDGSEQRIEIRQVDQSIHNAYFQQEISDNTTGLINGTDFPFASLRSIFYTPTFIPDTIITLTKTVEASDLLFGQTTSEFTFFVQNTFEMIEGIASVSRLERIENTIKIYDFDDDFGTIVILSVITIFGWFFAGRLGAPSFTYTIIYIMATLFVLFVGWASTPLTTLLIITIGLAGLLTLMLGRSMEA